MTIPRQNHHRCVWYGIAGLGLFVSGCQQPPETRYGDARGASLNGITGFVQLVKATGRRTDVWGALTPRMASRYSAIVILVSNYDQIPSDTADHISRLLWDDSIKTVLILVRDSDAAADYWAQVAAMSDLKADHIKDASKERDEVIADLKRHASADFDEDQGEWYGLEKVDRPNESLPLHVEVSNEDPPVTIDARWPLNRRLVPAEDADVLWYSGDDPLLTSDADGRILVLASAAPVLNGGLVDPGNRQLAEKLVDMLPKDGRIAISTSSRWSDGKSADGPSLWRFLKVHPHGWIFGQALFAMIIFCWWKLPIFGRPRIKLNTETVRFGRHVEALGSLLQRTRDASFARAAIRAWQRGEQPRRSQRTVNISDLQSVKMPLESGETGAVSPRTK